jgi:hypothetical protein
MASVVDLDPVNPELPGLLNYVNSELQIRIQILAIYQIFLKIQEYKINIIQYKIFNDLTTGSYLTTYFFPLATKISREDPYQAGTVINGPPESGSVIQRTYVSGFERTIY